MEFKLALMKVMAGVPDVGAGACCALAVITPELADLMKERTRITRGMRLRDSNLVETAWTDFNVTFLKKFPDFLDEKLKEDLNDWECLVIEPDADTPASHKGYVEAWLRENAIPYEWCMMITDINANHWICLPKHGDVEIHTGDVSYEELQRL